MTFNFKKIAIIAASVTAGAAVVLAAAYAGGKFGQAVAETLKKD